MSSRHMRRVKELEEKKTKEKKEPDEDSDDEPAQQRSSFQGLEVSSDSETEKPAQDPSPPSSPKPGPSSGRQLHRSNVPEEDKYGAKKKTYTQADLTYKQKLAQRKSKKNKQFNVPEGVEDEIGWLANEMNRKLGTPPPRRPEFVVDRREQRKSELFYINTEHLDVNKELAKVYGLDDMRSPVPLNRKVSHWIGVSPDIKGISVKGIVMSRYKIEEGIKYFRFTHNQDYRARCKALIKRVNEKITNGGDDDSQLHSISCVEACLENADTFYHLQEHKDGKLSVEQCLFCMQFVAEPTFNYADGKTRLLYGYVENRAFLIAVLKYIYILSNAACYITALALGKVLLKLDPTDPLCMLFIIDTLAIRAREFNWLLNLIEAWRETRQANRFFNMRYSRALALLYIALRTQDDFAEVKQAEADAALFKAIISYPSVVMKIVNFAHIPIPDDIKNHVLFNPPAGFPVLSEDLQLLINFYANLTAPRWREPFIKKWVLKVLQEVTKQYDESSDLRDQVLSTATLVKRIYRYLPTEMNRHLAAIRSMTSYVGEGHMPPVPLTVSFNPYPSRGFSIDTYDYFTTETPPQELQPGNPYVEFLRGINPNSDRVGFASVAEALRNVNQWEIVFDDVSFFISLPTAEANYNSTGASRRIPPLRVSEVSEVEIRHVRTIEETTDYFAAVFVSDEEKKLPMATTKALVIYFIVGIQMIYYLTFGEYIRPREKEALEEPPID